MVYILDYYHHQRKYWVFVHTILEIEIKYINKKIIYFNVNRNYFLLLDICWMSEDGMWEYHLSSLIIYIINIKIHLILYNVF
jgi:hypothetical protein